MEDIKRVKLSEIVELITKGTTPTTLGYEFQDEGVNFLKIECFDENGGFIESKVAHISEECHKKMKRSQLKNGDILFSIAGAIGRVAIVTEEMLPANINQALAIIRISDEQVYLPYIKLILTSPIVIEQFERKKQGVAQLNLSLKDINEISIPLPSKDKQIELAELFDKVVGVISKRNKELSALDDLIKARFVEMFGDPVSNPYGYDKVALSDLADIKIGPFGSLLHKEDYIDGGHPLLNPSHIVDGKVSPDDKLTISDEKYEELSAYQLKTGDVVMGRRGEMGRCAVVPEDGFLCGTGSMLIRTKGEVTADYIQKIISFPSFKKTIEDMAVGQTMPNLNVPIVSGFQIIKPPMEVQDRYYAFAEQVNKSKVAVQKALDETQMLFDSLMQKYFA
ncbi:restriction endonuclease subunit S [Agathobacter rectalis]|jgi:type I restriction enzyme S subunit|uniref:EcoKI restriction-modification system protein HsdS n=1 Tax=Agathobacter rectalis TaxID=39491 RepID=A0A174FMM7_9FIRM|nr:restriction endonuclease subunit S [Agathobacter rectalis]CUO50148.1 EcoKI restriction-modification system protein HsdS [Agathobacter rectalis]